VFGIIYHLDSHKNPKFQPLTRSRHPYILALYGYALNANQTQQYLVYEHAAKGPLDGFLHARLEECPVDGID
jgi:hypothetical protein